jgi:Ca2+-binding EF-hand superfamily protein
MKEEDLKKEHRLVCNKCGNIIEINPIGEMYIQEGKSQSQKDILEMIEKCNGKLIGKHIYISVEEFIQKIKEMK